MGFVCYRVLAAFGMLVTLMLASGCGSSSINNVPLSSTGLSTGSTAAPGRRAAVSGPIRKDIAKLTAAANPGSSAYIIGAQDVLEISVFKVPDLSKKVKVAHTGSVNLPLVGEIPAAGRTSRQLERELTNLLGAKYLQNPQVTVLISEYNSQRVTLDGAVTKPGVYPIQGRMTLLQLIAQAGGFTKLAESSVLVFRTTKGKRSAARFDIAEIRAGTAADPLLVAGDVVVAKTSVSKEAFENVTKVLPFARVFLLF